VIIRLHTPAQRTAPPHRRAPTALHLQDGLRVGEELERRGGLGDLELLLVHVRQDLRVQRRGHVALRRVVALQVAFERQTLKPVFSLDSF
jgi:hypothetical protein